ncbi:hypothetical protein [Blastococcus goldschmidtiae]|uniref:DUF4179 domain-containing protein n=1 Tax=Blastococcus goldschmidtiae TaxID=3075546 RepID=A0ABU2K5B4_9ACTN|nr:hypothetical protein [Blastococcus sp. DSM 46792]MDT0275389.1 hypothetical protein [Blastococcus sp. DSM 46792]
MTDPTERQLRELFAADAARAPHPGGLAALTLHRVRHRRRVRTTAATGLIAAVLVTGGSAVVWGPLGSSSFPAAAPTGVGELPGGATEDCSSGYSSARLAAELTQEGAFALDGTVTAIELGADPGPGRPSRYASVTFRVHTWYHGGSGGTVEVLLGPPDVTSQTSDVRSYGIGTRLLVSGQVAETAKVSDAPTTEDVAHFGFSCGSTRYYDDATAAEWAAVAAGEAPAGALPATRAASCPEYSPALVGERDFALDGTVTGIGEQRFPRLPGETESDGYYSVTFEVHTWYLGGTGGTVTLHMEELPYLPTPEGGSVETYGVGTRLLVSGVVSEIEGRGLIGQGCGYTRYHDEQTAAEWTAATD